MTKKYVHKSGRFGDNTDHIRVEFCPCKPNSFDCPSTKAALVRKDGTEVSESPKSVQTFVKMGLWVERVEAPSDYERGYKDGGDAALSELASGYKKLGIADVIAEITKLAVKGRNDVPLE